MLVKPMILTFFENHKESGASFQASKLSWNKLEMLFTSYTNISPSFILIPDSIQEK